VLKGGDAKLNSTKLYAGLTLIFAAITLISLNSVSTPSVQNPPKGPFDIGVGPSPQAALNKTELLIDIPDKTIDIQVTFRFNETVKYFIWALLPYTINQITPYAIYEYNRYPFTYPNGTVDNSKIAIGNFSANYMDTSLGSSIANVTLELSPTFFFHFMPPDQKDENFSFLCYSE